MSGQMIYMHYRVSAVGMALDDALDEMVNNAMMTEEQAEMVRSQFDRAISTALATQVRNRATLKGRVNHYRNCDNVWTFFLDSATIKLEAGAEELVIDDKLKIVACDGRPPGAGKR
ncbi:Transcription initiation factor IIA subunit 2 [Porphyridium purpureum]|uniref:Transcription initiation factor IIA subunit 2 n=1 Tax=Porphyridium purpureum TaxID=35688 RepID=A0A5J4YRZ1_PORPP|nr:Transcription initiation factor IIA subunit 2 [Porphyridium purpureum]|eukprot:POR2431..scf229_5